MVKVKVVVVTLSAFFIFSEAAVTVEVISGLSTDRTIECGQNDKIRCVVSPFPGTAGQMAWTTDSQSLIQCFDSSDNDCSSLSVDHYTFSSRLSDESFNLTFNTVKLSDGSVEFRCSDTIETASVMPLVRVMPDTATTTNSSSGLELEVITGCVYPVSAITFEWYYMDNGERKVLSTQSEETEDSTDCTIGMIGDCGGADVKKITSRLTTDSEGEEYNIYVDVIHADAPENDPNYVVTKSFGMFKVAIAPTPEPVPPGPDCCFCMIGCPQLHIVLCIILCILIILVVVLVVVIIAGMVVEAIFVILGNMSKTMRIVSFCAFLFGLGLFLTDKIRQRLARRANPSGGHAQPDHAQPLQDRPVNFN